MSTRAEIDNYNEGECFNGGTDEWTASWRGDKKLVLICRECTLKILPALFADATYRKGFMQSRWGQDLERFRAEFWRVQANNMSRSKL